MRSTIYLTLAGLLAIALSLPVTAAMTSMREPLFGGADKVRQQADELNASLLAPTNYSEGAAAYDRAEDVFNRRGSVDTIRRYLSKAESGFTRAAEAARIAAIAFNTTIHARSDALATDTPSFATSTWDEGERYFQDATRKLERGSIGVAERAAEKAENAYRAGELVAIKTHYLSETVDYIAMAKKLRAERYAPESLANAIRLLEAAEHELTTNRYDTDKPRSLAADAKHNALHAIYVAKLENRIRNREVNLEAVLLDWEAAISRLGDTLDQPVYFDYGATDAIDTLLQEMERIKFRESAIAQQLADRDMELAGLNEQALKMQELLGGGNQTIEDLEVLLAEQQQRLLREARHRERFNRVEELFEPQQATVLRQGDTMIIRMIGLNFDSGRAALKPEHREILAGLEQAIAEFPESRILVEGHTDAFGSDADNLGLSQTRADSVVAHLLGSLPISPANLNAMGFGESRPVANNETAEGRKRNRRIDVVIKPQWIDGRTIARAQLPDLMLEQAPLE